MVRSYRSFTRRARTFAARRIHQISSYLFLIRRAKRVTRAKRDHINTYSHWRTRLNTSHRCLRACRAVCCVRRWARHRQDDDDDGGGNRSRCHVSQVRHQHYDRSPGTNAICRAASASPTSPMRSVAAPRVKLASLIVSVDHVDHKDLKDVASLSPGLSILDTPNQHMGIDRYRARAHEPPTPRQRSSGSTHCPLERVNCWLFFW